MFTRKVRGTCFIDAFKKQFILQYSFNPSIFRNMSKSSSLVPIIRKYFLLYLLSKYFFHEWYLTMTRRICWKLRVLNVSRGPGFLAVVGFRPLPQPPPSPVNKLSLFLCVANRAYWEERGREGSSQIIRRRENLALHTSVNTLWVESVGKEHLPYTIPSRQDWWQFCTFGNIKTCKKVEYHCVYI